MHRSENHLRLMVAAQRDAPYPACGARSPRQWMRRGVGFFVWKWIAAALTISQM
jgi:hypothetical protein